MQWRGFVCLLLSTAAANVHMPAALAEEARPAWNLDRLMANLRAVKTAQARFVERKYISMLDEPMVSSGILLYTAPDRLEKRTALPREERLIVENDTLTVEDNGQLRAKIALQDHPEIGAIVDSIRATLAGDLPSLKRFYDVRLEGDAGQWRMLLQPIYLNLQKVVKLVRISGHGQSIDTIEENETDGDRSVIVLSQGEL